VDAFRTPLNGGDILSSGNTTVILEAMKTAISIPDPLFQAANALAARLGVSRSELIARAVSSYVVQHDDSAVTRRLDEIYAVAGAQPDPALVRAQARLLRDEGW
jgi:hypothetical protein